MSDERSWWDADSIREPKDDNEREQALKLGMLILTGIQSIHDGQTFSGLPCGFEALISANDRFWTLEMKEKLDG